MARLLDPVTKALRTAQSAVEAEATSLRKDARKAITAADKETVISVMDQLSFLSKVDSMLGDVTAYWRNRGSAHAEAVAKAPGDGSSGRASKLKLSAEQKKGKRAPSKNRAPRNSLTPEKSFYEPIVNALRSMGGSAKAGDVLKAVDASIGSTFNEYDRQKTGSGATVRWKTSANNARTSLIQDGRLRSGSPRGIWELATESTDTPPAAPSGEYDSGTSGGDESESGDSSSEN